jgi:hypothetical protein
MLEHLKNEKMPFSPLRLVKKKTLGNVEHKIPELSTHTHRETQRVKKQKLRRNK